MAPQLSRANDHVRRAVTEDGAFRVLACLTTETTAAVVAAQRAKGAVAQRLADLVTGAILVRETMAPDLRVQVILSDGKKMRLVADALPEGVTRGLVQIPATADPSVVDTMTHLLVMRSMHNGALQQGHVELEPGQSIAQAIMEYFRVSEQITSFVALGTRLSRTGEGDRPQTSAGYVVQVLPEVTEAPLQLMTERLDGFPGIDTILADTAAEPQQLLARLLEGIPHDQVAHSPVSFGCNCSPERLLASLATLPPHDLRDLASSPEMLETTCDYCGREYKIAPEHLRGMLANN